MKFSLNNQDFIKSLLMAVLFPALYIIQASVAAGNLTFNWKEIAMASIGGLLAYLIKNFFTDTTKGKNLKTSAPNDAEIQNK